MLPLVGRAILPAAGFQPACLAHSIDKKPPEKAAAARIGCPTSSDRVGYSTKEYLDDVLVISSLPHSASRELMAIRVAMLLWRASSKNVARVSRADILFGILPK
jgi:hypothetical protein